MTEGQTQFHCRSTHNWVKLPVVRRCCQVSYMVVTSILLVVSP
jgi:hypothetical protein